MRQPGRVEVERAIPVVDFEGFVSGDRVSRGETAAALRTAIESYGFLYLRNHSIPALVLDALFAQSRKFFSLPRDAKEAIKQKRREDPIGYEGVAGQALGDNPGGDLKEMYHAGPERPGDTPNLWPESLPSFREVVLAFHEAAIKAGNDFMCAVAVSLTLPEDYFEPYFDRSNGLLRLLHYPPVEGSVASGQIRAGAHTDFGSITLLFQDNEGGLEIQAPDGTWLPAPVLPGAALINTGDLMERWTNGQFRSSPHRVAMPVGEAAKRHRYSVAFFYSPNEDAVISCMETCQGPTRPPKYPPIVAKEHIRARALASRRHTH